MITEQELQRQLAETSAEKKRLMDEYTASLTTTQPVDYSAALAALDQKQAAIKQAIEDTHRKVAENAAWREGKEYKQLQKRETELIKTLDDMRQQVEAITRDLTKQLEKMHEVDQEITETRRQLGGKQAQSIMAGTKRYMMVRTIEQAAIKAVELGRFYELVLERYKGGRDTWNAGPANPPQDRKKSRHSQ